MCMCALMQVLLLPVKRDIVGPCSTTATHEGATTIVLVTFDLHQVLPGAVEVEAMAGRLHRCGLSLTMLQLPPCRLCGRLHLLPSSVSRMLSSPMETTVRQS